MKVIRTKGSTSNIEQIFIADSSSTTGAGLTGLTNATSGLTAYYHRKADTTATAISLVTMTVGTFTSSGFKEIDSTNMPGWYQFCPPDACYATGDCAIHLKGATNMAPLPIEIQLTVADFQDTVRLGLTAIPNVASGSAGALPTTGTGSNQISVSSGAVIVQSGTGTGQISLSSGLVALTATEHTNIAGDVWNAARASYLSAGTFGRAGQIVRDGTAQAGAATTITLDASASSVDSFYLNDIVSIVSGTGAGQSRFITAYVGSTKVATVGTWATNPDNTSVFRITGFDAIPGATAPTAAQNADAVWNQLTSNISTTNSIGVQLKTNADIQTSKVWDETLANHTTVSTMGQVMQVTRTGTAQAGASTSITLDSGASATDNIYDGATVFITAGTGARQSNEITAYNGTTKVATVRNTWVTNPASDSVFVLWPGAVPVDLGTVWDANRSSHTAAGSFGEGVTSVQGNVTGSVASVTGAVGSVTGAVGSVTGAVGSVTAGVTVTTNNDKTGYTASTVSDKTGYALSTAGNASVADKLLGRNLAGGADGTRTVQDALRFLRNKWSISGSTLTVTQEDDTTSAWTATTTTAAGNPVNSVDPA
jgi:hypothetical protein